MSFVSRVCVGESLAFTLICLFETTVTLELLICVYQAVGTTYGESYVPHYVSSELRWKTGDSVMTYIDGLKYEEYVQDSDKWHKEREVLNFVIIHYQCRRDSIYSTLNVLFGLVLKNIKIQLCRFSGK